MWAMLALRDFGAALQRTASVLCLPCLGPPPPVSPVSQTAAADLPQVLARSKIRFQCWVRGADTPVYTIGEGGRGGQPCDSTVWQPPCSCRGPRGGAAGADAATCAPLPPPPPSQTLSTCAAANVCRLDGARRPQHPVQACGQVGLELRRAPAAAQHTAHYLVLSVILSA